MSISGPHLGYWYSSNSLFNSGLWLMKRLKGLQCMHQLTFTDEQDPQNTFFYRLCKVYSLNICSSWWNLANPNIQHGKDLYEMFSTVRSRTRIICHPRVCTYFCVFFQLKTLENFKNIILVSSPQVLNMTSMLFLWNAQLAIPLKDQQVYS
jgi:hypothetical protein